MTPRRMSEPEWLLLDRLLAESMNEDERAHFREVRVLSMDDGGMGSFALQGASAGPKKLTTEAISRDTDGVELLLSLFSDRNGRPAEVDIWKVDFSPLHALPEPSTLRFLPPVGLENQ